MGVTGVKEELFSATGRRATEGARKETGLKSRILKNPEIENLEKAR